MGRKNKGGEASNNKNAPEKQQTQNPNPGNQPRGAADGGSRQQGGGSQQGGARAQQQGADVGRTQQGGPRQQGGGSQQGGAWGQQQGADVGRTQQGGARQQGGGSQQGGAWGQQQGADVGRTQQGGPRQQGGGSQQGGAWGQQQGADVRRTQQGGARQQGGGSQQGGTWGQQQGADVGRTQQGGPRQQGGGSQQGGAWGQQQGADVGRTQQGGARQQGGGSQQGGAWGQQQGADVGRTQQGGSRQQGGGSQQGGAWGQQQGADVRRTQQGGPSQQGGGSQQGGARAQQQGAGVGRTQQDGSRQQGGGSQQGGTWGQQQGADVGRTQQGGARQQGGGSQQGGARAQQQGADVARTQQGGSRQQGGGSQQGGARAQQQGADVGRTQQGGSRQQGGGSQQGGRPQGQYGRQQPQQQTLQQNMGQLSISNENPLPVKQVSCNGIVRGTLGNPGTVEVNYLRLNLDKMPNEAYHYDITITPDKPKKFLRPAFEQFNLKACPDVMLTFDGSKSCYSLQRLQSPMEVKVEVADSGNRKKEFVVELKETDNCVVHLKTLRTYQSERVFDKPMRALQVLEVVLASNNHERGVRVGRSFFRRPDNPYSLDDGYEAWTGLFQAAILGEMPLLNVDISHKSFPCESTLIDYLSNTGCDLNRDLSNNYHVSSFLKGIEIVYSNPALAGAPKSFKVLGIGEPASKKTFKNDAGQQLTVQQYFQSLGYKLKYPNLNCLTVGSTVKQISLPMELCSIASGQVLNRKDQPRQTEKMVRYAATSTNLRKQKIMALLKYFDHNTNSIIRSFGLSLGSSFLKVPMRMLPSPFMEYLQGRTVTTFKGAWRMDNNKFLLCSKPPNGFKWAIFYEDRSRNVHHELENFKSHVIRTSASLNMNLQNSAEIVSYNFRQLESMLQQRAKDGYDLVFVVLSERGTTYAKIKQIAELQVGILTQCIKEKTVFRTARDMSVFSNILLKVNGKLNGTNHKIAQDKSSGLLSPIQNVMYLGADVTHPSPDQRHIPSVVGVAASHDAHGACYNCQYRLQRSTVENIEDMESIFSQHLEMYHKYQMRYPGQIIYYRDGVSDGQFPIVEREEIRAIKRACKKKGCDPKLTCVIVVKRHHTRFFPLTQPQNERDFNNVQAGTVVDQYITHPNEVQFFMVSHQSIQGTARPTRYNVILDESKFDINLLQKLTYNLCHLFPRCNRAVSYPAPAYLAHLVAFRGRVYLEGTQNFGNLNREYEKRQIKPHFMSKTPMYFI